MMMVPRIPSRTSNSKLPIETVANSLKDVCIIVYRRYVNKRIQIKARVVCSLRRARSPNILTLKNKKLQKMQDKTACSQRQSRTAGLTPQRKSRPSKLNMVSSTRTTPTAKWATRITTTSTLLRTSSQTKTTAPQGWWSAQTRETWARVFMAESTNSTSWLFLHLMADCW